MKWYEICHTGTYQYVLVHTSMYLCHSGMYKYMNINIGIYCYILSLYMFSTRYIDTLVCK